MTTIPARALLLAGLLVVPLLLPGCGDDEGSTTGPAGDGLGSLFVSVQRPGSQVVAGATVTTSPASGQHTTGATGTVLIDELPLGTYVLTATHSSIGSGNSAVTLEDTRVRNVTVTLVEGAFLQPLLNIQEPDPNEMYSYVDSVRLRAVVSDDEDAPETIALEWASDVDGVLSTTPADASGVVDLLHPPLSLGPHVITLTASDSRGHVGRSSRQIQVESFAPQVVLESPPPGAGFVPGELVEFRATVTDRETANAQLAVRWESDLDGVLNEDAPDSAGNVAFDRTDLSRGEHLITLRATDGDGNESMATVEVANNLPARVVLQPIVKDAGGLNLEWSPVDEPDFSSYRIHRSTFESGGYQVVDILDDPLASGWRDTGVQFGETYWYWVGVMTGSGTESESNRVGEEAGISISVATQVEAMEADPIRPYLYALDRVNNSLLFINTDTNELEKTIFVGSSPTGLDLNFDASELVIANFGSTQLTVVDLATQEVDRNLNVQSSGGTWGGNPYRLACVDSNKIVYVTEDQWSDVELVQQADGVSLHQLGSLYQPDLASDPAGTRIFLGESGISRSLIARYDVQGDQMVAVDSYSFGSYTSRSVVLSGDGQYVFYGRHKFLASNLSSDLGTFGDVILVTNHDGSIAVGSSNIYDAVTFGTLRTLPLQTQVMALSADGQLLYLYDSSGSDIYLFDMTTLVEE